MSDSALSSRRRRARQTGTVEDRAAVLVARMRAGTLTRERLELAAYCGDEAARGATDEADEAHRAVEAGDYPEVDRLSADGDDDSVGWVYRVRWESMPDAPPRAPHEVEGALRVLSRLLDPVGGPAADREAAAVLLGCAALLREQAARYRRAGALHRRIRGVKRRESTGLGRGDHPGEVWLWDTIEGDDGRTSIDVEVRAVVECHGRGEDADLSVDSFEAFVGGVRLPDEVTEKLAEARGWESQACEFETPWGWVRPGVYRDIATGERWEVLGAFKVPDECTGLVVCRRVSVVGLPVDGWRLADLGPWLHEEMAPEVAPVPPGHLRQAGAVDAPDPSTQAGPWERVSCLLGRDLWRFRGDAEARAEIREAAEIAEREAETERARRCTAMGPIVDTSDGLTRYRCRVCRAEVRDPCDPLCAGHRPPCRGLGGRAL